MRYKNLFPPEYGYLEAKITTARFYAEQLLPQTAGLLPAVTAGADRLFEVPISQL